MKKVNERYTIHRDLKREVDLGLPEDSYPRLRVVLEGDITLAEYRAVFGPEANMVLDMCLETTSFDNRMIRIFMTDVLAHEQDGASHQGELINALLRRAGMDELDEDEIRRRAKGMDEISPAAAWALLGMAEAGAPPGQDDPGWVITDVLEPAGLGLADFLNGAS